MQIVLCLFFPPQHSQWEFTQVRGKPSTSSERRVCAMHEKKQSQKNEKKKQTKKNLASAESTRAECERGFWRHRVYVTHTCLTRFSCSVAFHHSCQETCVSQGAALTLTLGEMPGWQRMLIFSTHQLGRVLYHQRLEVIRWVFCHKSFMECESVWLRA